MDWIAAILMLIGNVILIKYKSWVAFMVMGLGNILYLVWWFQLKQWPTFLLVSIFAIQNIWGIISWRKNAI